MRPDTPDSADLLRTAMAVMKADILPLLPEDAKLDALMILAVMAAAERDLQDATRDQPLHVRQDSRLSGLLRQEGTAADLCAQIRSGAFDDPSAASSLTQELMADVRDRLALVNPKYLEAADKEPGDSIEPVKE